MVNLVDVILGSLLKFEVSSVIIQHTRELLDKSNKFGPLMKIAIPAR